MPLSLLPPAYPLKPRDSLKSEVHQPSESGDKINSAANEAASHRRRLYELRRSFLGLPSSEDSSQHRQTGVSTCTYVNTDKQPFYTMSLGSSVSNVLDSTRYSCSPSVCLSTPAIYCLSSTNVSHKLHESVNSPQKHIRNQFLQSSYPNVKYDQLDTTDHLPSPNYLSFVYSNPPVTSEKYASAESSLSGTLTTKPSLFINRANFHPLVPETVHLSSDEFSESSSSSDCSHDYFASTENLDCPKSNISITSLKDVTWLSEQCKKNESTHSFSGQFLDKDPKQIHWFNKYKDPCNKSNPNLFYSTTNCLPMPSMSSEDTRMSDRISHYNLNTIQPHDLHKNSFSMSTDRINNCYFPCKYKCASIIPANLKPSIAQSHHDDSQLHSPTMSVIGRCFSVSPNYRLSNSLFLSHNNHGDAVVTVSEKLCSVDSSKNLANRVFYSNTQSILRPSYQISSRSVMPRSQIDQKRISSESLTVSDIQDITCSHSYSHTDSSGESRKQRNRNGNQRKNTNSELLVNYEIENQNVSGKSNKSKSRITSKCDKGFTLDQIHTDQPELYEKQNSASKQNFVTDNVLYQSRQLALPKAHTLKCTDEDVLSYETSLTSLPSSAWSSFCPANTPLDTTQSHNSSHLKVPLPDPSVDYSSHGCHSPDCSTFIHSNSNHNSKLQNLNVKSSIPEDACKQHHRNLNAESINNCKSRIDVSGSSSDQSPPSYVNILHSSGSFDMSSGFPSSDNLYTNKILNTSNKRSPRPSSDHSRAYWKAQNSEMKSLRKSNSRHDFKPENMKFRMQNIVPVSKISRFGYYTSESSSILSVNYPDGVNDSNGNFHHKKYPIHVNDTQKNAYIRTERRKILKLAAKISHYLENNREIEVKRFVNKMLRKPESRRIMDELIPLCGDSLRKLLDCSQIATIDNPQNNSTSSLVHLATSLSELRASYVPDLGSYKNVSPHRRDSCGSMLSSPWNATSHDHSWPTTSHNRFSLGCSNKVLPFQGKSISSLYSPNTVRFIKWPSKGCIRSRPPPLPPPPPPIPPVLLKITILPPDDRIHVIDTHAIEVTNRVHLTFSELISDLTTGMDNDVEIIRSLYRWTTAKDIRCEDYDSEAPSDSLIGMLRLMKYNQLSRNEMFYELCRYAGLQCLYITGYSKGAGYRPGMPIRDNRLFRNTWLAVYVSDGWRFVNCNWGARYLSENLLDGRSSFECDEFYFLTDPEQHVFENLPDLKVWQLLRKPLSMNRFCHLPLLKSPFFNANLSLKKNYSDCLVTKNGQVSIKVKMSKFVGISCSLENCADHSILLGLCLVEILVRPSDTVRIEAAPSQPGKYYLNVYVSPDWRREDIRELACSFQIHCSEYNYSRLVVTGRLPEVGFLGRTPASQVHGVLMVPEGDASDGRPYIVHNDPRPLRIPFAIAPGLKLCHQLKSFDRPGHQMADCDSYALLQMKPSHQRKIAYSKSFGSQANAYYSVRLPVQAFYYLTIYASSENDITKDHLECVYRVLIDARNCRSSKLTHAYPRQTFWWVHCRLLEPTHQHLFIDRNYKFCLDAPHCDSVAVVINESEWHFLTPSSSLTSSSVSSSALHSPTYSNHHGRWYGKVYTGKCLGQLSVFGRIPRINKFKMTSFGNESRIVNNDPMHNNYNDIVNPNSSNNNKEEEVDENSYIKLLDYVLVEKESFS
ncbi:hypothetical protein MN116_001133 [Schistosoma mekongi]|uniref:KY-like immunoglobulin-like domain-containing protein n=1 Tax=Schistosoma mekongi TaxID=38744 RepID=A0AAE2D9C0_SCHME|nr:hypothetical protein MN116_001133 [Schistosoma mekongi]